MLRGLTLHLLVPGLLNRVSDWGQAYRDFPRFPHIEYLLATGRARPSSACGYDAVLCALAGLGTGLAGQDLPLGALTRYGLTGEANSGFFLCVDPVHLRTDSHELFLLDSQHLHLQESEARALVAQFNEHFEDRGVSLEMTTIDRWHLRLAGVEAIRTHPLREAMGKNIQPLLPTGEDAMKWKALLNEVQMLFHNTEVNRVREARGELSVNSVWLSGAGVLPAALEANWAIVWADDPLAIGLGRKRSVPIASLPASIRTVLDTETEGSHIICQETLFRLACYDDFSAWHTALEHLQEQWFAPLITALKRGDVRECYIHDCAGQYFVLHKGGSWRFWKRVDPLPHYAISSPDIA